MRICDVKANSRIGSPLLINLKKTLLLVLCLTAVMTVRAQVSTVDSLTAAQLAQKLVGSGITYFNPVLTCDPLASGKFNVVSSNLGLDSGVILTTGRVTEGEYFSVTQFGINAQAFELASTDFGLISSSYHDAQLDSILAPSGTSTNDACTLEFDFVSIGDSFSFRYVFASEEYTNYSCTAYNDLFAFFLSGPGYANAANIALIPGTNIPVAVNSTTDTNINGNGPDCMIMGPGSPFSQYYVDNLNGSTIVYNGFTKVFKAEAAVQPCSTYHIKLVIADAGDGQLDSGVFIEAGSFKSNHSAVALSFASTVPGNGQALSEGCSGGVVTVKRSGILNDPQTVHLLYGGSAIRDVDYTGALDSVIIPALDSVVSFPVAALQDGIAEGMEYLSITTSNSSGCYGVVTDSVSIPVMEGSSLVLVSHDTSLCGAIGAVVLHVQGGNNLQVQWTSSQPGIIQNPSDTLTLAYPTATAVFTAHATTGCGADSVSFTAIIGPGISADIVPNDTSVCLKDSMMILVNGSNDSGFTFLWEPAAGLSDSHVKQPEFFSTAMADFTYTLTVSTPGGCTAKDSVTIHAHPPLEMTGLTAGATVKYGDEVHLNADGALYYTWFPAKQLDNANIKDPVAKMLEPTLFTVYGINDYGCRDTAVVMIDVDYAANSFIPTVFSPNNDGRNDEFRVVNTGLAKLVTMQVFNRWGQMLFSSNDPHGGWDGSFKGVPQEIGTYQYIVYLNIPDASGGKLKMYKGDVALVR